MHSNTLHNTIYTTIWIILERYELNYGTGKRFPTCWNMDIVVLSCKRLNFVMSFNIFKEVSNQNGKLLCDIII